ncbi:MAG: hypothetical protein M3O25_00135 [Actinomycetota bacterium]|nr:hypothetical protein [Actinomycetota bacterium]
MTGVDWLIVAFGLLMAAWGYKQGLIVGLMSLAGFAAGAALGSRVAPELLAEGAESPYAPVTALVGALLIGGLAAVTLEGVAHALRRRLLSAPSRTAVLDAIGGAVLLGALGLALSWLFGPSR